MAGVDDCFYVYSKKMLKYSAFVLLFLRYCLYSSKNLLNVNSLRICKV